MKDLFGNIGVQISGNYLSSDMVIDISNRGFLSSNLSPCIAKDYDSYSSDPELVLENLKINPFVPNAPFLYLLKTSEKCKVFWCFQGLEKGCIGDEWVNNNHRLVIENLSISSIFNKFQLSNLS